MSELTLDRRLPLTFGLEPRYVRERRDEQARKSEPAARAAAMAEEALATAHARELIELETARVRARGELTATLRQRVLAAKQGEPRRWPPVMTLPLALGVSVLLWLGLGAMIDAGVRMLLNL